MMSYGTMKRLLGETNFELKSLVMFGLGLIVLATTTFALYWWQTSGLVEEGNRQAARQLIPRIILAHHWKWDQPEEEKKDFNEIIDKMSEELQPADLTDFTYRLFNPGASSATSPENRPSYFIEVEVTRELKRMLRRPPINLWKSCGSSRTRRRQSGASTCSLPGSSPRSRASIATSPSEMART